MSSGIASLADVSPHFEDTRAAWLAAARAAALRLGEGGALVTADDVRRVCPPPAGSPTSCLGAVFLGRAWQRVGYTHSTRPSSHGRVLAQFRRRGPEKPLRPRST